MAAAEQGIDLVHVVALLGAAVVAVPLAKRAGLGSVLGYLAAGLVIGPFGLKLFTSPQAILHVAELGVVMFLFIIGLEMQPSRLWALRREIFGLGVAQVVLCGALLTGVGVLAGFPPVVAFLAAMGFVLSSTAIVAQILEEGGDTATPYGQRVVSILLLEDLAIVPLLVLVAVLAPGAPQAASSYSASVGIGLAAIAALLVAGKWLLNPLFRILAEAHAREVMTAAALLVVLGAALIMQLSGLSMAMGAFLAGVLLSESTFRHQLEADIEPFRGILLGLFFLGVGMALDLTVLVRHWQLILVGVPVYMAVKSTGIYIVARLFKANNCEGIYRATLLAQGGEFAFVLYAAATTAGIFDATTNAILTAMVIISMALTPLGVFALRWILPDEEQSMEGVDTVEELHGNVLVIGFGRFGQVASQSLMARGFDVSIIDIDTEMIRVAGNFGFKVYYGDGCRLDVLRAAGAGEVRAILVCVDKRDAADRIVALVQHQFPLAKLLVRSFDRAHALKLVEAGVDVQIRETFESALKFGGIALRELGVTEDEAEETVEDIRRRDAERFALESTGGLLAGRDLLHSNVPTPVPFTTPRRRRVAGQPAADGVEKGG
ncbi:MAG TPA: monovalent cation:proton antiporter-2 (CPA2) family protein [Xanthobacteraceae bacterium]|nr:monovalent cation:proton antiporter-2 (CPA2) family protein [Xanthobacteraceae bacterium]